MLLNLTQMFHRSASAAILPNRCCAFGIVFQYANFLLFNSTLKFTFAPKASKTFKIVVNLASVVLFSIFEIWAFFTPTSSPNSSCVKLRSCRACLMACPNKSRRSSFSNSSRFFVPFFPFIYHSYKKEIIMPWISYKIQWVFYIHYNEKA